MSEEATDIFDETHDSGPAVVGADPANISLGVERNGLNLRMFAEVAGVYKDFGVVAVEVEHQNLFVGGACHEHRVLEGAGEDFVLGVEGQDGGRAVGLPDLRHGLVGCREDRVHASDKVQRVDGRAVSAHLHPLSTPEIKHIHRPIQQSHVDLSALVVPAALQRRVGVLGAELLEEGRAEL